MFVHAVDAAGQADRRLTDRDLEIPCDRSRFVSLRGEFLFGGSTFRRSLSRPCHSSADHCAGAALVALHHPPRDRRIPLFELFHASSKICVSSVNAADPCYNSAPVPRGRVPSSVGSNAASPRFVLAGSCSICGASHCEGTTQRRFQGWKRRRSSRPPRSASFLGFSVRAAAREVSGGMARLSGIPLPIDDPTREASFQKHIGHHAASFFRQKPKCLAAVRNAGAGDSSLLRVISKSE